MPAKPSLKQRLGIATQSAEPEPPPSDGQPGVTPAKRGVKQRLQVQGAIPEVSSASGSQGPPTGIQKRLRTASSTNAPSSSTGLPTSTMGSSSSSSAQPPSDTSLLQLLKRDWAKGALPSWKIQEYAHAAATGGITNLNSLGGIAAKGKWASNAQRDLMKAWGKPLGAPNFSWRTIPVKDKGGVAKTIEQPFVLPHELFAKIFAERPEMFQQSLLGDEEDRQSLWSHLQPTVLEHPHLSKSGTSKCIPIGMHGDGGAFNKEDNLIALTFNSLVGQGKTTETRFLITLVKKSQLLSDGSTLNAIFRVITWSFNSLLQGCTPSFDPDGHPISGGGVALANGWHGACIQIRGDWQFYCQAFGLAHWRNDVRMCWLCRASSIVDGLFWTDFNPNAGWRNTIWSHQEYLAMLNETSADVPELFNIVGLRLEMIMADVLHAIDLGVAAHVLGNVFFELLPNFGNNQQVQIKGLHTAILTWYKLHKVTSTMYGALTLDKLRSTSSWPKLKAKAAAIRNLVPFAVELCSRFNSGSVHDTRRLELVRDLALFYDTLRDEGRILSQRARNIMFRVGTTIPTLYAHLAAEAASNNVKAWKIVPKHHLFQHLCLHQAHRFGNPRFYWTYADEDMVGHMMEVAKSCHPSTLTQTAMFKCLVIQLQRD